MLTDQTKTYEASLLLGVETDTEDAGGKICRNGSPLYSSRIVGVCEIVSGRTDAGASHVLGAEKKRQEAV